ncbi:MAG: TonB-dependent receptor [Alistipes sp.]
MIRKLVLSLIAILGVWAFATAQNKQISGTVAGEDGTPIIGATVLLQGSTSVGTSTVANGYYTLRVPANGSLVISFIGYQPQTIPINGRTTVDVVLKEDTQALDEVLVVAFGTQKKEAFTGSATVVKSDDIAKVQTSNAAQALAGQVAGVQLTNASGAPGSNPTIRIRGFGSITAGNDPLYIVDGSPYEGDMNNINPNDIESMTVLKDAASNALYGARGAGGVIMITTKRAKAGDAVVNVDAKWGVNSRALKNYDYIDDPALYYETHYSALYDSYRSSGMTDAAAHMRANANITGDKSVGGLGYPIYTVPEGQYFIGANGKMNPNATLGRKLSYDGQDYYLTPDNWEDEAYRTSLRQEYNVSVSGATERSNFYASFGYLNNKGITANSDMSRYTARLKADYQAKKWLKVGANASYANFNWNSLSADGDGGSSANVFAMTSTVAPIYPLYVRDGNGNIMHDQWGHTMYDYGDGMNAGLERPVMNQFNAISDARLNTNNSEGNAFNGTGFFEVSFLKDFKFTFNAGVGLDETRSTNVVNRYYGQFAPEGGIVSKDHARTFNYNLQQLLSYNKTIHEDHTIDVMLGHEYYKSHYYSLSASKKRMFTDNNLELDGAIVDGGSAASYRSEYNNEGYFGRVQYDYKEKVFVSGSYRRDASSRFHPDHRWGNFWSVGAAWLMNKENWFHVSWIDMLKVKASYGSQGNDNIGNYRYVDLYSITNDGNGQIATPFYRKGNENITWETNTNLNIGAEFDLFKGRLSGSFEFFRRKTTDMLFSFPVSPSIGYSSYYDNIGDMRNSGIELNLNAVLIRAKNVQWNFNMNLTHLKNKVVMLPAERRKSIVDGHGGFPTGTQFIGEGLSLYTFYLPHYVGVNPETGAAVWDMDVKNDAGEITGKTTTENYSSASKYLAGTSIPDLYGGFGTSVNFYGFDFGVNFTYQIGGLTYDSGYSSMMGSPSTDNLGSNIHQDILKAWTPQNANSNIPRYRYGSTEFDMNGSSDRFLVDASYLNIQNLQFGYTLPSKLTRKIGIERIRVYLACDNVYYWSYRKGLDPRYSFSGSSNNATYSPIRTISGGINIQF